MTMHFHREKEKRHFKNCQSSNKFITCVASASEVFPPVRAISRYFVARKLGAGAASNLRKRLHATQASKFSTPPTSFHTSPLLFDASLPSFFFLPSKKELSNELTTMNCLHLVAN